MPTVADRLGLNQSTPKNTQQQSSSGSASVSVAQRLGLAQAPQPKTVQAQPTIIAQPQQNIFQKAVTKVKSLVAKPQVQNDPFRNATVTPTTDMFSTPVSGSSATTTLKRDPNKLTVFDKVEEIANNPIEIVPFLSSGQDVIELGKLTVSANRLKEGKATAEDVTMLKDYVERQNKDKTFGYKVLDVVSQSLPFAGEMLLTAGIVPAGKKVTLEGLKFLLTKSGKELLEKKAESLGVKIIANIGARTLQTPIAGATRIAKGTLEKQLESTLAPEGKGENLSVSLAKSFGEQWVETLSEFSGGAIDELAKPIKDKLIKTALFKTIQKVNPTRTVPEITSLVKKIGYDGVINEMLEERVSDVGQGVLFELGLGDQPFKLPTANQLAVELVSFSVPGATISVANQLLAPGTYTPQQVLDTVLNSPQQNTEEAKKLIKEALTAQETGDSVVVEEVVPQAGIQPQKVETNITDQDLKKYKNSDEYADTMMKQNPVIGEPKQIADQYETYKKEYDQKIVNRQNEEKRKLGELNSAHQELRDYYKANQSEKLDDAMMRVFAEMDVAEAGEKIFGQGEFSDRSEFLGYKKSTFPQWVPEDLRSKDLFNKVLSNFSTFDSLTLPDASKPKLRALYQEIIYQVDSMTGLDSSSIVEKIINLQDNQKNEKQKEESPKEPEAKQTKEVDGGSPKGGEGIDQGLTPEVNTAIVTLARRKNSPQELAQDLTKKMNTFDLGEIKLTKDQQVELQQWDNKFGNSIMARGITSIKEVPSWIEDSWNESQMKSKNLLLEEAKKYDSADEFIDAQTGERPKLFEQTKLAEIWKEANKDKIEQEKKEREDFVKETSSSLKKIKENQNISSAVRLEADVKMGKEKITSEIEEIDKKIKKITDKSLYQDKYTSAYARSENNIDLLIQRKTELGKALDVIELEENPEMPFSRRASSKLGFPSGQGSVTIGEFEPISFEKSEGSNVKIHEAVKKLVKKYAERIGEGYLPRGASGVYMRESQNIRINGMNDLSVATHEIAHFLDYKYDISSRIMKVVGYTKDGKPKYDKSTSKVRKEITALYERYYVGGKKTHSLKTRTIEGFATLIQKYAEMPQTITQNYPKLVVEFLSENGQFYEPIMSEILTDVKKFIVTYQGLSPLDKIGARTTSDSVEYDKGSFLNLGDRVRTLIADNIYPIEKLAKIAGVQMTEADPSLHLRQYNSISGIIATNLVGKSGYYRYKSNEGFVKTKDFNWKTLVDNLLTDKVADSFGNFLVARATYFDYQRLDQAKNEFLQAVEQLKSLKDQGLTLEEISRMVDQNGQNPIKLAEEKKLDYLRQREVLRRDGITRKEATSAYLENVQRFAKDAEMYDELVRQDLELLKEPEVGLISETQFEDLTKKDGYASRKRQMFDEIVGQVEASTPIKVGKTRISSLVQRTGSSRTILNPVYSSIKNHSEIVKKAYRQVVHNKVNKIASVVPDLAQQVELVKVRDKNGRTSYPQDKDPQIIMTRINGKRYPVLWDSTVKTTIDDLLNPTNVGFFEKILLGISRSFTKGTTALFPQFALTNFVGDQITGTANTVNNYIPIFSPLKNLSKALTKNTSVEAKYFQEYLVLGGERQTFVGWQDLSSKELMERINNERKGLLKVIDKLNQGLDVLAIPAKYSEISTRATEYIKSRLSGKNQVVSLEEAGRVTAPFHHVGTWGGSFGKTYVKSIPFFNPTIQVLDQTLRQVGRDSKSRARVMFVFSALTGATVASFGLMAGASDDQRRVFKDLQPDELVRYIWLPNKDGKTLNKFKIQEYGILGNLINMALANSMYNAGYTKRDFISGGSQILPQQFNLFEPIKAFLSWVAPIIKIPIETALNKKDFPKIMDIENEYLLGLPAGERAYESTGALYKWLGKKLDLSPVKMEFLITGLFGRTTGLIAGKPGAWDVFGGFKRKDYFTSGRTIQNYYNEKTKIEQEYKAIKEGLKKATPQEVERIRNSKDLINMTDKYLKAYRDLDLEKDVDKARKYRDEIMKRIELLNQINLKQSSLQIKNFLGQIKDTVIRPAMASEKNMSNIPAPLPKDKADRLQEINQELQTLYKLIKVRAGDPLVAGDKASDLIQRVENILQEGNDIINRKFEVSKKPKTNSIYSPDVKMTKKEEATVETFDKYEIPREVIYGMSQAETGSGERTVGSNNIINIGSYDKDPRGNTIHYKSLEEASTASAKLLSGVFTKANGKVDTRYKEAWENRDDPVKMLKLIEKAGFAGDPKTWKARSIDQDPKNGAGLYFDSWSDFVMATKGWKRWHEARQKK